MAVTSQALECDNWMEHPFLGAAEQVVVLYVPRHNKKQVTAIPSLGCNFIQFHKRVAIVKFSFIRLRSRDNNIQLFPFGV